MGILCRFLDRWADNELWARISTILLASDAGGIGGSFIFNFLMVEWHEPRSFFSHLVISCIDSYIFD